MKIRISVAAAAALLTISPAFADYKSEYRNYKAAIEAQDFDKALEHGEAAWREAEEEIGETTTTAILAYNYAMLAAPSDPARASEAFARAIAIAQKSENAGAIPLQDAIVRLAEARSRTDPDSSALAEELQRTLDAADPNDASSMEAQAIGFRTLAAFHILSKKYKRAQSAGDRGEALASRLNPPDPRLHREILFLAGLSRIAGDLRTELGVYEAVALFDKSFGLYPPQKDIDHFDPLLAQAIAWRQSVKALANSYGSTPAIPLGSRLPSGEDLKAAYERADARSNIDDEFYWETPHPDICNPAGMWRERKPPSFPARALRKGSVGAILVGYDLDGKGVARTVVLTDFTEAGFGDAALASMKDWRLNPGVGQACWKNLISIFLFEIH